ncbi:MAG: DUF3048 domain-containing protein [Bacillota bacterium]|nr:MAG: DUF3048 domain-containing protein [Bacillota bacterium]
MTNDLWGRRFARCRGRSPGPLVLVLAVLLTAGLLAACGRSGPQPANRQPSGEGKGGDPPAPAVVLNPLTGLPIDDPETLRRRPILVSIDNHPEARPQAALTEADLVYEVPAEGGITRFLALFITARPERVGPVRSSRHYFLDLAQEWDAIYVYAGGSPQHYARIAKTGLPDLDGVRGDPRAGGEPIFRRDGGRRAPHNLYASLQLVQRAAEEKGWGAEGSLPEPRRFRFEEGAERLAGDRAEEVRIYWPGWSRGWVRYVLRDDGRYERHTAYGPHRAEETGAVIAPANVLIQFAPAQRIAGDDAGRLDVDVVGEGRLYIISGGWMREGRWEKDDPGTPTAWLDEDGGPARLLPGPTWVHIVPEDTRVEVDPGEPAGGTGDAP